MKKEVIVVALGGNALGNDPATQKELVKKTAESIVDLYEQGYQVIVGHGNGPQVGMIHLAMSYSAETSGQTPEMPFAECGAMSQGYIGYHLQQAITNVLQKRNIETTCATVITQVLVDEKDPAFRHPTKPIGSFYTKEEAEKKMQETGDVYVEDAGRGYRKVVASPIPKRIQELEIIQTLANQGNIVIAVGGGGIPVIKQEDGSLTGISAVIDKDFACSRLAIDMHAEKLIILTAVENVCIHFHQENETALPKLTYEEAKQYCEQGEFAPGSMLPKIQACMNFVKETKQTALITSLEKVKEGLFGQTGTEIIWED